MRETAPILGQAELDRARAQVLCVAVVPRSQYSSFALYWIQLPTGFNATASKNAAAQPAVLSSEIVQALKAVLIDELQEDLWVCPPAQRAEWGKFWQNQGFRFWAEKQFLPGVTDNLAHTVAEALRLLGLPTDIKVASGRGYLFTGPASTKGTDASWSSNTLKEIENHALYRFFHPITENFAVHDLALGNPSEYFAFPDVRLNATTHIEQITLEVDDQELAELSRSRLLALNLAEMKAIRQYFRKPSTKTLREDLGLTENPTDVELEVIAQTWSEHCKHKIFNATITHSDVNDPVKQTIHSLYKTFIQEPTKELMQTRFDLLSVFKDNSGVIKWDKDHAICFKVETHNSPSALEPYGGALTGILGVNRDILGTGLGAKPIFNTDVFCFAFPNNQLANRPKLLPAKTILDGVRKGVEDGGNKSGIPTVNGAICFDDNYRAKPLVFCGTGGIMPLLVHGAKAWEKHTQVGDTIVMAGGRVGKDGVHGATFSSESLHSGSPVSAVQIGDPFTQKRLLDFTIEARDLGLITGITDNGAGGLSSSVGEMAQTTNGAVLELDNVPLKYAGLADWEIVVSESQERMTIATQNFAAIENLARKHSVEVTNVGNFTADGLFKVTRQGKTICALELSFLHDGCPTLELVSEWMPSQITMSTGAMPADLNPIVLNLLAHPNICSRENVIRQYDHEVQGQSVIKPLMGPKQLGPCDAAVIAPVYGSNAGLSISNGLNPRLSSHDPYLMAVCCVDEAVRNAVCVGADPASISLLDNFCWPDPIVSKSNPHGKRKLAQLVRTCMGLRDAVLAYNAPLISGKDSMKNDFDDGTIRLSILPTLLVSAIGRVPDINDCVSMEFKEAGDLIYLLKAGTLGLAASHYEEALGWQSPLVPSIDLSQAAKLYAKLHQAIRSNYVASAHDLSEGGLAVALAECVIGSNLGATINSDQLVKTSQYNQSTYSGFANSLKLLTRSDFMLLAEGPAHIVVSVAAKDKEKFENLFQGLSCIQIGEVTEQAALRVTPSTQSQTNDNVSSEKVQDYVLDLSIDEMEKAWRTQLPFD
jgi:phosphoribosylformylglycinamidine synthase